MKMPKIQTEAGKTRSRKALSLVPMWIRITCLIAFFYGIYGMVAVGVHYVLVWDFKPVVCNIERTEILSPVFWVYIVDHLEDFRGTPRLLWRSVGAGLALGVVSHLAMLMVAAMPMRRSLSLVLGAGLAAIASVAATFSYGWMVLEFTHVLSDLPPESCPSEELPWGMFEGSGAISVFGNWALAVVLLVLALLSQRRRGNEL